MLIDVTRLLDRALRGDRGDNYLDARPVLMPCEIRKYNFVISRIVC